MGLFGFGKKKQEANRIMAQEQYERGARMYNSKMFSYAKDYLEPAAKNGHAGAQFMMGEMTWNGWGMEEDEEKAAYWYAEAAKQGHAAAQYKLGFLYYLGNGVKKDYGEAIRWYELAAKGGNLEAAYNLGELYEKGRGCAEDMDKAIEYWKIAAEQGHESSLVALGDAYRDRGEKEEALKWFRIAEEKGNYYASQCISEMGELDVYQKRWAYAEKDPDGAYQKGLAYAEDNDYEEAYHWIYVAAEKGCVDARFELAQWYYNGKAKDGKSPGMAAYCMKIAAENGHVQAMYEYAWMLATGYGVEQDLDEAETWAERAVEEGHDDAVDLMLSVKCATFFALRCELADDFETAYRFYYIDAVKGDARAQYKVGVCYLEGKGVPKDADKAIKWLKKAAEQDHDSAQNRLAHYYLKKYSYSEAETYFRILAEKGDAAAMNNLAFIYDREGTSAQREEIMELLEGAAERGSAVAMYNLAKAYMEKYDTKKAKKWALAAKEAGHEEADALLKRINK